MFYQPREIGEALELKARHGDALTPIAGGTDLLVQLNRGQLRPAGILDLTCVDALHSIRRDDGFYEIGATAPYAAIAELPIAVLSQAALSIGGPQIRARGTLGGNLGTASPAGDGCVALLALDGEIELVHATRGRRRVPAKDFFLDYRRTQLAADELITGVRVPAGWETAWFKLGKRSAVNISLVCCGIGRSPAGQFCLAFGCAGPVPLRAGATERVLNGGKLTPALIEEAASVAMQEIGPIDDQRASAPYRRAMCGVAVRRLLARFLEDEKGVGSRCGDPNGRTTPLGTPAAGTLRAASRQRLPTPFSGKPRGLSACSSAGEPRGLSPWSDTWHWRCTVNGQLREADLPTTTTLLQALREYCGLTGTKGACLEGECGSCTVLLDGVPVTSCLVLAAQAQDRQVTTIEGLARGEQLHPLQQSFLEAGAVQCGYCTPGLIMATAGLLQQNPRPTGEELLRGLEGNLCRCTGYEAVHEAVERAAQKGSS